MLYISAESKITDYFEGNGCILAVNGFQTSGNSTFFYHKLKDLLISKKYYEKKKARNQSRVSIIFMFFKAIEKIV